MADRIELVPIAIERLSHSARLDSLRADTPEHERKRAVETGVTVLDALCGRVDHGATDEVWDILASLDRRALLTLATFAITELSDTDYSVEWRNVKHSDST